jgi:ParB family chromosome partitioning protein
MTQVQIPAVADRVRATVALRDLAVAPENLRFAEAADAAVPQLADTIRAAGLMQPLTVRPGRGRKEAPYLALDGRRRLLALQLLAEGGDVDGDFPVDVFVETDPARQGAAAILTNTAAPVHVADVIAAIGRMLKARLDLATIAGALGYAEIEIRRLAALADLPPEAFEALRGGRLSLRQARLLARLPDRRARRELARLALDGHGFQEWRVREALAEGQATAADARLVLVGAERYLAAGGRVETDLFGELPDRLLDPGILTRCWEARVSGLAEGLRGEELEVALATGGEWSFAAEEEPFGYARAYELPEAEAAALRDARATLEAEIATARGLEPVSDGRLEALARVCRAEIAVAHAASPGRRVTAVALKPDHDLGVRAVCFGPPAAPVEDSARVDAPDAADGASDTTGVSHAQHRLATSVATGALMRALAEDPRVAGIALAARLWDLVVAGRSLRPEDSASRLTLDRRGLADPGAVEALHGVVEARLEARRAAQQASGEAPLAWIAAMSDAARAELAAELFAATVDLQEARTDRPRRSARTEAEALLALTTFDLGAHWTPDAAFAGAHSRAQLLAMLEAMGAADEANGKLKKPQLVDRVVTAAAERRWLPPALSSLGRDADGAVAATEGAGTAET